MATDYDPEDEEHVTTIAPLARPDTPIGNVEAGKKLLTTLFGAFQRMLACDQVAATKWYRTAVACLHYNPDLLRCDQLSFVLALMQCAELGLMPGPTTGHAYLVPFQDNRQKLRKVTLIPGYKGMVECAYRSGQVAAITADCVFKGDEFSFQRGTKPFIHHVPAPGGNGERELTHAYVCVHLRGSKIPVTYIVDKEEAKSAQSRSASGKNGKGPWVTDTEAMWMKTAMRRVAKWIPMSFELRRLMEIDARAEDTEDVKRAAMSTGDFLSGEGTATVSAPQPSQEAPPRSSTTRRRAGSTQPSAQAAPPSLPAPDPSAQSWEILDGPPEAEKVPAREPGDDTDDIKAQQAANRDSQIAYIRDLEDSLTEKGQKPNLPQNLAEMSFQQLKTLSTRLAARLESL